MTAEGLRFTKGHGTENDFVLLTDPGAELPVDAVLAARLCDRRAGLGADGLIRAVRTAAIADAVPEAAAALAEDARATWFMDHRNADGSTAEMCGNGVRVLVAHLLREGLVTQAELDGDGLAVGTRSGVKRVRAVPPAAGPFGAPWFAVDMGPWRLAVPGAERAGADARVEVPGLNGVARPGLSLDLGNPHTVVALADTGELAAADLTRAPVVDPPPAQGTNVELVVPLGEQAGEPTGQGAPVGRLAMRVHERGVGETRSCGTGACAAALAARAWAQVGTAHVPDSWLVDVPGGTVAVRALPGQRVELAGPAVLVADGTVDAAWLARP